MFLPPCLQTLEDKLQILETEKVDLEKKLVDAKDQFITYEKKVEDAKKRDEQQLMDVLGKL